MILTVASTVSFGSLFGAAPTEILAATKMQELKKEKAQVESERSQVESGIDKAEQEIGRLQGEQKTVESEIQRLDLAMEDTNGKIREKTQQIDDKNVEIEKLQAEVKVLKDRIQKRNEMLKDRARNFQETGGMVSYVDVLMGSKSFGDFVDRASAVATIMEADQDILKQHQLDKEMLEKTQAKVEAELEGLKKMRADLEGMKVKLDAQIKEKNTLMASLHEKEEEMEAHKLGLQEETELLAAQSAAIQKAINMEAQRQAEAERQRQEAARRAAQNSGGSSSAAVPAPPVSSGAFTKPANGRFTSGFGQRWGELHAGVDIANSAANVPVVAAADGVVIRSYYSSSYGNCIFIAHSINGQVYTTVYAHLESRGVGSGATVSKGQQIGYMGNTGQSTGKHLHFEIHKGPWNAAKSNAVDPMGYL